MDWLTLEWLCGAQFSLAALFHFLFVPLSLGLPLLIAVLQTKDYRRGDETCQRAARFWGRIFLINFSLVVVSGLGLVLQLGVAWPGLAAYAGGVIGPLLAIWAGLLFFLTPACVALWRAGQERLGKKPRLAAIWLIFLAGNFSILWLCLAYGWLQNPGPGASFIEVSGAAELVGFGALLANPYAWGLFAHNIFGAWTLSGFFVLGVSALRLLFKADQEAYKEVFRRSARLAAPFTLAAVLGLALTGYMHAGSLAETQPAKLAAMAAHWETAPDAPLYLLAWPDQEKETNLAEALPLPGGLNFLARDTPGFDRPGLRDFPREDRPPILATFLSFRLMLGLGGLFLLLAGLAAFCRKSLEKRRWLCRLLVLNLPLPYLALAAGWLLAESGRQPWIIYQVLRAAQAAPPPRVIGAGPMGVSLIVFGLVYACLGLAAFYLMFKAASGANTVTSPVAGSDKDVA